MSKKIKVKKIHVISRNKIKSAKTRELLESLWLLMSESLALPSALCKCEYCEPIINELIQRDEKNANNK